MTPDEYCSDKIGGGKANPYYSLLFAAPPARRGASAVHAFVGEMNDISGECHDPGVAQTKLDWWREEIDRLYRHEPRHPVTQALAPLIAQRGLEREHFLTVIAETARTFGRVRCADFELLYDHCMRTGGVSTLLVARMFDLSNPAARAGVEMLGVALRLTDIVCHLGRDIRRDRLFLPAVDLRRYNVDEADLLACRHTPAFALLMAFEVERAENRLDDALARLPTSDRTAQLPGVILARLARAQLNEVRRDGYHVLDRHVALTPLRRLWIAWCTRVVEQRRA